MVILGDEWVTSQVLQDKGSQDMGARHGHEECERVQDMGARGQYIDAWGARQGARS